MELEFAKEWPGTFYTLKLWNAKTGQNDLCTRPKEALYPTQLFAKVHKK